MYTIQSNHTCIVLVNYHMDTLSGIGYRSEHIHSGYPCKLVDIYTERKGYTLWEGIFPPRESLVSDIPAGDGKMANLFLQCIHYLEYSWCGDYLSICRCTLYNLRWFLHEWLKMVSKSTMIIMYQFCYCICIMFV